jgi:threonine dehydrogenase-like Zn-dependent dehydrogenase
MKFYYKGMLAVHLEDGRVEVREVPLPRRPEGFALLRLLVAGICNTDLELQRGYYGFSGIPGHEFVAEVVEADHRDLIGKRVVGEINLACRQCEWCRRGLGRHCPTRTVLGILNHPGAFAEYLTLPEANLHVLPDSLPSERAVFAEPLAAACEILDQVAIPPGTPVAVLGDGKLGILIALVLRSAGYPVHHFGKHVENLMISSAVRDRPLAHARGSVSGVLQTPNRDRQGADGPGAELGGESSTDPPPATAFEWVVDATGHPEGLRAAVAAAKPRGTIILKSTVHGMVPIDTAPIVVNELTLVGSRCGRFEASLPLLDRGTVRVEPIIADRFPLAEAPRAFARAAERGVLKVLLTSTL